MAVKALDIYQGNDWMTYRWPVAQAFDTLDRIRDLCLHLLPAQDTAVAAIRSGDPAFEEIAEEDAEDALAYVGELCADLAGEFDAVHAELSPFLHSNPGHRWLAFEMRIHLKNMTQLARQDVQAAEAIITLVARIKNLLKQIDQ